MDLKDKTALVTGSTRGIGKGIAFIFAKEGAQVAIKGTRADLCNEVSEEIAGFGGDSIAVPMMDEELSAFKRITGKSEEELRKEFLDLIPLERYETPVNVANLVLFLASEKTSYITGQAINVTGEIEMH